MTATLGVAVPASPKHLGELPLTQAQVGLLVTTRLGGDDRLYNVIAELGLGEVSERALRETIASLLAVQPALRMGLHELPRPRGELVAPPIAGDVPLSYVTADSREAFIERRSDALADLSAHRFTPAQAPLVRFACVVDRSTATSALFLCVHHAVFDGFSLQSLITDLNALLGGELDVADVADVARHRERLLRSEVEAQVAASEGATFEAAVDCWAQRLQSAPDVVLYPRPGRPAATEFRGERREVALSKEQSADVDAACQEWGVTPFTFFSGAFAAAIARHAGADRVVVGTPVLSRRTIGSYQLCGFFVNTLPLVVDIDWDADLKSFLTEEVAGATALAKRDAHVPWAAIVRRLRPDRHSSRNAVFSCMIAMQDATTVPPGGAVRSVREHGNGTAKLDLWLGVTPTPDGWLLELETDADLLPRAVADGIQRSLLQVITEATGHAGTPLSEVFTDASIAESMTSDGFDTTAPAPTLSSWLKSASLAAGAALAVDHPVGGLSHEALEERVSTLAAAIAQRGVSRGTVVGLTTDNLPDTVTAMLAILRLGGCYLPLDLGLPAERLESMAQRAQCRLVVGLGTVGRLAATSVDELLHGTGRCPEPNEQPGPVYVMFTSGSTGQPKGVVMPDGPLLNLTAWQIQALGLDRSTRFLQYAPLGFDVSFQEIVPVLAAGGTVVSAACDRRDLPAVVARTESAQVTHVYLPVAALRAFVQAATAAGAGLAGLRYLCVSGEQLLLDAQVQAFFAEHPWIMLVNLYGPTETHAVTTHVLSGAPPWPQHVPIGVPIGGVTAQVIDRTGHLAPLGVAGELYLGGRCPAEGYINDPEQTAARFVPDTRAGSASVVRYRTGDQVLWDESGLLVFLGRDDDQVKIRGYRVELGEVESMALERLEVVHAVAAVRGEGTDRHLVLFVVGRPDTGDLDEQAAVAAMGASLPSYMAPRRVFIVDVIPKTPNGKVDRPRLLADAPAGSSPAASTDEAGVCTEQDSPALARARALWAEHLDDVERLRPDASLLDAGAHSLTTLAVLARIEAEYGVRLPMLAFFRTPTLRFVASALEGGRS